jgi:hypothetical protein
MIPPAFRAGSPPKARSIDGLINLLAQLKRSGVPGTTQLETVEVTIKRQPDRNWIVSVQTEKSDR